MSSSIAQQKAYVESLDRKAVEDGLRNGHPIIAQFLFADRAKRMQQNDTAIEALEKAAGIPEEGQNVATQLADYLAQGGDQPGKQITGQGAGQGAGQGVGQGPGMPMNAAGGGLIPRYQDRGLVEEEDFMGDLAVEDDVFGPFDEKWAYGTDWLRPKSALDYALLGATGAGATLGGVGGIPGAMGYLGRRGLVGLAPKAIQKIAPNLARNVATAVGRNPGIVSTLKHPFRTMGGAASSIRLPKFLGGSVGELIGRPLVQASTRGGIPGFVSRALTGRVAPAAGASSIPAHKFTSQMFARLGLTGGLGSLLYGHDADPTIDGTGDQDRTTRRDAPPGPGGVQRPSTYDTLMTSLDEMRDRATTETGAEADLRRGRVAEAERILNRKETIQDLLPTAEQDKLRRQGTFLGELSDVLGRRQTAPGDSGFGSIGKSVRDYDAGILQRDLGVEEVMAGLDSKSFGVTDQTLAELARLSRADTAYDQPELNLMLAKYEAEQKSALEAQKLLQEYGRFKPAQWETVSALLTDPEASQNIPPEILNALETKLIQSMLGVGGTGGSMSGGLQGLMEAATEEG